MLDLLVYVVPPGNPRWRGDRRSFLFNNGPAGMIKPQGRFRRPHSQRRKHSGDPPSVSVFWPGRFDHGPRYCDNRTGDARRRRIAQRRAGSTRRCGSAAESGDQALQGIARQDSPTAPEIVLRRGLRTIFLKKASRRHCAIAPANQLNNEIKDCSPAYLPPPFAHSGVLAEKQGAVDRFCKVSS